MLAEPRVPRRGRGSASERRAGGDCCPSLHSAMDGNSKRMAVRLLRRYSAVHDDRHCAPSGKAA